MKTVKLLNSIPLSQTDELKKKAVVINHPDDKWITDDLIKTKKCQPAVRDTLENGPHPSVMGVGVPDGGLARPQNKNKLNEKRINYKSNYLSHITLVEDVKRTKVVSQSPVSTKIKKCQPAVRDTLENGPHPSVMGVGVPDGGLACPQNKNKWNEKRKYSKINYLSHVTLVNKVKRTKQFSLSPVSTKTKKCQPVIGDSPDLIQTAPVPNDGLSRPKKKKKKMKNTKIKYLSNVTLVEEVKCTKLFSQSTNLFASSHSHLFRGTALHSTLVSDFHSISNKRRNNLIKQMNGNGKNSLSICHWNLGSKKWRNKRNQIQALADQDNPDVIFISEANLDDLTPPHESLISGYNITLPKTVTRNGTARLVLLTRENLDFKLRDDLMDDVFSSIWIKILRPGSKGLLICGLYREHQYLNQDTEWSLQPAEQCRRWAQFLRQVDTVRLSAICHIIGYFNLDFKKWTAPDHSQLQMITDSKNTLEAGGFFQLVNDVTHSWPGQVDSLIDHFWTNEPNKIISVTNKVRAVGDHNVITATIQTRGSDTRRLDTKKRSYKNFDPRVYRQRLENENWSDIF